MKLSALVLVVLGFVAACDRGEKSTGSGAASASPSSGASNAPEIKLLDAGKDPKQTLRFAPQKGAKQTLTMALDMGLTMTVGGAPRSQTIPTIQMPMDVVVTDIAGNGDIKYRFELKEPSIIAGPNENPAVVDAMKGAMVGMAGLSGNATVTSRGFTKDVDIKVPAGANPQVTQFIDSIKQSINQMSAPLPAEAVGIGAKWQTTTRIAQNGVNLTQVATNEIIALDKNVVTLGITLTQSAPRQKISKDGMTAELQSYSGTGAGNTTLDLGQVAPRIAKIGLKSEMELSAGSQNLKMGFDMTVTMTGK